MTSSQMMHKVKCKVTFEELIGERLLLMPPGEGYRYLFDDELAKRNLYASPAIELADTETILKKALSS